MSRSASALIGLATAYGVSGAVFATVARPRISRWGATDEEVTKTLPGDELPAPYGDRRVSTRAITIDAPPDEVWPWLVQMGSGRAGFYTHEWVERLLFITYADGHSSTRVHPEWQDLKVGDRVPYSRLNTCEVTMVDRPRVLIAGEWLVLEPLEAGTRTRLIARTRGGWLEPFARMVPVLGRLLGPIGALVDRWPLELLHHYMEPPTPHSPRRPWRPDTPGSDRASDGSERDQDGVVPRRRLALALPARSGQWPGWRRGGGMTSGRPHASGWAISGAVGLLLVLVYGLPIGLLIR